MGFDTALNTGVFLWTSWGVLGLLVGVPVCLVLFKLVTDSWNSTKRFETIFKEYDARFKRQDQIIASIQDTLQQEKEARTKAEKCNAEYRTLLSSYSNIISTMLGALRMMQSTRRLTKSSDLDKEIDVMLINIQTELKRHNLMNTQDSLLKSTVLGEQDASSIYPDRT